MKNSMEIINQDFVVKKSNLVVTKSLIGQAEDLAAEHEQFNEQYVIGGRKALYEMLGKIYTLVELFDQSIDKADLIKMVRKSLQEQYGIKTQDNTSDTTVLVRFITRADRKTAHVYARAIEAAREDGIKTGDFPAYIERGGGIERIRAIGVDASIAESKKELEEEKVSLAHTFLSARCEIPFASFDAPNAFRDIYSKNCAYELVICSMGMDGKYNVIGKLPADQALEAIAIKYFAKYLCKDIESARKGVDSLVANAEKKKKARIAQDQANRAGQLV